MLRQSPLRRSLADLLDNQVAPMKAAAAGVGQFVAGLNPTGARPVAGPAPAPAAPRPEGTRQPQRPAAMGAQDPFTQAAMARPALSGMRAGLADSLEGPSPMAAGGVPVADPNGPPPAAAPNHHRNRFIHNADAGDIQGAAAKGAFRDARRYRPYLNNLYRQLYQKGQNFEFYPEERAAMIAPGVDYLDRALENAGGELSRSLEARGLGDSSAMVGGQATLAAEGARARAGLASDLTQKERDRQDAYASAALEMAAAIRSGRLGLAAQIAESIRQQELQQQQIDAANNPFNQLAGIAGGLGQGIGSRIKF